MDIPTAEQIRSWSNVSFAEFGYPEAVDPEPDRLVRKIAESAAELQTLLGFKGVVLTYADVAVGSALELLTERAIQMLTEYNVASSQQSNVETASDFDMIQSTSVGPISETRRSLSAQANIIHPWPALNKLLWGIISLELNGTLEGLDPGVPVIQSVEDLPNTAPPGYDLMYARRWMNTIFGDLRPLGVYRQGDIF